MIWLRKMNSFEDLVIKSQMEKPIQHLHMIQQGSSLDRKVH